MKYLDKKFSTPGNSRAFVDNWDAVFGEKPNPDREQESAEVKPATPQESPTP